MTDMFLDEICRLRLPPVRKTRKRLEPLLSRILLGFSAALIPALCFYLPGLLIGKAGETKSTGLMLFAVTAAVVALFQSWCARLRWTSDRPVGLVKSLSVDREIIAMVPVRDLAALELGLVEDPALAVEQALNLFKVMVRLLSSIVVVAPLALAWEMLFLFAFGGLKMPLLHAAVTGLQIIRIGDLARSLMAFDALVVSFGAVIMLVAGKQPSRRFGFRNIYRDRRDAYLREQFSVSDDEAITIATPSPSFTPVRQRSF